MGKLGLQEPAEVGDIGEVAQGPPRGDGDVRRLAHLHPEGLEHGRISAGPVIGFFCRQIACIFDNKKQGQDVAQKTQVSISCSPSMISHQSMSS